MCFIFYYSCLLSSRACALGGQSPVEIGVGKQAAEKAGTGRKNVPQGTSVRLDVEENQLLRMAGKIGLKIGRCKAHEIWVFSKTETDGICERSVERGVELEFLRMMAMRR